MKRPIRPKHYVVTDYWLTYYASDHCTLCGNTGVIDTRGVCTPAGVPVGRCNWCICPNGQAMRASRLSLENYEARDRSGSGTPTNLNDSK